MARRLRVVIVLATGCLMSGCGAGTANRSVATTAPPTPSATTSPATTSTSVAHTFNDVQLRPVTGVVPGKCVPQFQRNAPAASATQACSAAGDTTYQLGPAFVTENDIATVTEPTDGNGTPTLTITLTSDGEPKLATATQELAQQAPPLNELAVYAHNEVVAAPAVSATIVGGTFQLAGEANGKPLIDQIAD